MKYINPYKLFRGIFIPDYLFKVEGINYTDMMVYGLLCRFAGEDGKCFPSQTTLAAKMKVTRRTIEMSIARLKKAGLIEAHYSGETGTNWYRFLHHPAMDGLEREDTKGSQCTVSGAENTPEKNFGSPPKDFSDRRDKGREHKRKKGTESTSYPPVLDEMKHWGEEAVAFKDLRPEIKQVVKQTLLKCGVSLPFLREGG